MRKNEPTAAYRTTTLYIFENDGVTPAPMATVGFTVQVRTSGGAYAAATGTFANVGVDGEWEYIFTQAETDVSGNQLVVRVTKTGFNPASAIEQLDSPDIRNILGLAGRHNALLDGGSGFANVQYNGNGVMTGARLRVFASQAARAAATAGHADGADSEIARYIMQGTDVGSGLLAQFISDVFLEL